MNVKLIPVSRLAEIRKGISAVAIIQSNLIFREFFTARSVFRSCSNILCKQWIADYIPAVQQIFQHQTNQRLFTARQNLFRKLLRHRKSFVIQHVHDIIFVFEVVINQRTRDIQILGNISDIRLFISVLSDKKCHRFYDTLPHFCALFINSHRLHLFVAIFLLLYHTFSPASTKAILTRVNIYATVN